MAHLFEPLALRGVTFKNRIAVSPMCQYSSIEGAANAWHLVNLGSRAVGGAGLVFTEAAAVTREGRITPDDLGIWSDGHVEPLAAIAAFVEAQRAVPGIQLAHAGRKASSARPWDGGAPIDPAAPRGWTPVGPSAAPFTAAGPPPSAMMLAEIAATVGAFAAAARRAVAAGFRVLEVHAAHGYLLHEFLSPLVNGRTDAYGGPFENRVRLTLETVRAIRAAVPEAIVVFVRISATDWAEGGWDVEQSVELARALAPLGVDLVDVSSGGAVEHQRIAAGPGYQVPFAERIRAETGVPTGAVGLITAPEQAEAILARGAADMVLLGRELLRDPYWPLHAAAALGAGAAWPPQYERARPRPHAS